MIGRLLALAGVAAGAAAAAGAAVLGRRTARRTARAQRKAERLAKRARLEAGHPERAPSSPAASGLTAEEGSAASAASPASAGSAVEPPAVQSPAAAPPAVEPPAVEPPAPHALAGSESAVAEASFRSIRGIGPALEERLREAGVTSIAQVAAWSEADIEAVAPLLKVTPERIRSQAWVEQAQSVLASRPPD